ncbi:GntR family transcriptional regulator [Planctomonas psychrotolerans]|uniref:GntR family transcriptional regulator n=1 Tax=Planctomonas psychrotolerans TaxID=2528712 RepID=UPI001238C66D|nr:GntR family transcriptional regulator [Planctomonas psychrotolerans]
MTSERRSAISSLGGVDRHTLRELTLARLREAISVGQLPPGTHLAEVDLSEALTVSRGTLREALRHLEQEGLVQSDARGRLRVRVVEAHQVEDIFAVRAALETLAFETICARSDRGTIVEALRTQLSRFENTDAPMSDRLETDLDFHATMCRLSGNETLYSSWLSVRGLSRAAMTAAGPDSALANMAHSRHLPIVELLEQGDVDAGRAFLHAHMEEAADRILVAMNAQQSA